MTQDGIDLSKSSWENPDGFKPAPRPAVAAPEPEKTCDAPGPDGWLCDLKPGHGPDHRADNGQPGGVTWYGATICDAPGPNGWLCDLKPGHGPDHHADNGQPGGVTWHGEMAETTILGRKQQTFIPAYREPEPTPLRGRVFDVAQDALKSESPTAWVRALDKISEMCRG